MIFLGLGDINKKYIRHNIGHMFLDQFAEENKCQWIDTTNYQYFEFNNNFFIKTKQYLTDNNIILELFEKFDFSQHDLIVVHDDLFLPLGKIRMRISKRKNPYKSIELIRQHYTNFIELKIGIMSDDYIIKNKSIDMLNYINHDFIIEEYQIIMNSINNIIQNFSIFNTGSLIEIQTLINN